MLCFSPVECSCILCAGNFCVIVMMMVSISFDFQCTGFWMMWLIKVDDANETPALVFSKTLDFWWFATATSVMPLIASCTVVALTGGTGQLLPVQLWQNLFFFKISFVPWIFLTLSHSLLRWLWALQYNTNQFSLFLAWKPLMRWWFSFFSILFFPPTSSIFSGFLMVYSLSSVSCLSTFHPCESGSVLTRSVLMRSSFSRVCQTSISTVSHFPSVFSELTLIFRNL